MGRFLISVVALTAVLPTDGFVDWLRWKALVVAMGLILALVVDAVEAMDRRRAREG